jgi:hypothetical protein
MGIAPISGPKLRDSCSCQLGFTLADLPGGLHASQSQGKRHDIVQLGEILTARACSCSPATKNTPTRLTPTRCWRICPPLKANAFIRWGRKPSAWITTAPLVLQRTSRFFAEPIYKAATGAAGYRLRENPAELIFARRLRALKAAQLA